MTQPKSREIRLFGAGVVAGFGALVVSVMAIGFGIAHFAPERMPAPAVSRVVHLDEKLRFIRDRPALDPALLAVGSSVTWRQIDGEPIEPVAGGPGRFFNGGTGLLQIHQTRATMAFYLDHFPNVRALLVMVSLPDFGDCTTMPAHLFEMEDASRYAFHDWPAPYFYLRYVSPQRYLRTVLELPKKRIPYRGELFHDAYGSSPLQIPEKLQRGLRYGRLPTDDACVAELEGLLADAVARDVEPMLVFAPVHPDYRVEYPREMAWLDKVAAYAKALVERDGRGIVIDLTDDHPFTEDDFFDAFHLQWSAVRRLAPLIARSIPTIPPLSMGTIPTKRPVGNAG
jgi:hypothetical protein